MKNLVKKAIVSVKNEGVTVTMQKTKNYVNDSLRFCKKRKDSTMKFVDVLFINGCTLPHPTRYRVYHQAEQLLMANVTSDVVYYEDLQLQLVNYARVFVFYRCPCTEMIELFIEKAKQYNKIVIFDIDDLVFDEKYTKQIKYIQSMTAEERKIYNDGVKRIGQTLNLCSIATTTTEELAEELAKYVPNVYINRNVASDSMVKYSEEALSGKNKHKRVKKNVCIDKINGEINLGYFSGSITHNDDFAIILPAICRLLKENRKIHLYIVGDLDLPKILLEFKEQIHAIGFMDWTELPFIISQMDINLAPLEDTLFNRAKSENKWTEASLVKVITIASNVGAFRNVIQNGVTGILCDNSAEAWYEQIKSVIKNKQWRNEIANNAYNLVINQKITLETAYDYASWINHLMSPSVMFKIPTAQISGGILVAQKHACFLQSQGIDVSFINDGGEEIEKFCYNENEFPIIRNRSTAFLGSIDIAVATLYTTMEFVQNYPNIKKRIYFVQNMETLFPLPGNWDRIRASQAYIPIGNVSFITISKWCQEWLNTKYHVKAKYAPNGIDCEMFYPVQRDFSGKIRILVEGNSDDHNKNVDESFQIIQKLDAEKFEIWFVSYQGKAKDWYHVDRFFRKVPNSKMPELYQQCHILLKSSTLESFSYPPLEMMATGGVVVARPNDGNREYLTHEKNCLFYNPENLDSAIDCIQSIVSDGALRTCLISNGIETANSRAWKQIESDILKLYGY